jgi:HK97 family phage major capsid protein
MTPEQELKEVLQKTGETITQLRSKVDELDAASKKKDGDFAAFEKKANDRLDELDAKRDKLEKELTEERRKAKLAGDLEAKDINGQRIHDPEQYLAAKQAFENFVRTGSNDGSGEHREAKSTFHYKVAGERKTASVISDPNGGYTVMREFSNAILKKVYETSPILSECSVETIGTDRLEGIIDDNEASSGWVGEAETRTTTNDPEIGEWSIPVREVYAMPAVTQKLLDDSQWNYEQFLIDKASEYIDRQINYAMLLSNTNKRPRGIMTYTSGTNFRSEIEQVNMLDANLITADGLIKVQESLKDAYRAGAKWYFNRQTRRAIRTLKDSEGRYLLEPSLQRGAPNEVLGDPMVIFQDMADVAANALAVLYGDMKQGYKAVRRTGMRILRDPYTVKGQILIYMTIRIGGDAWNKEAVKIGKVAA